jgi:hypothetical protein
MRQPLEDELTQQRETIIDILAAGVVRYLIENRSPDTPLNSPDSPEDGLSSSRTDRFL